MSRRGISGNGLKWIAILTMLTDHAGLVLYAHMQGAIYEYYQVFRYIGRISFPIYCFLLVEGFYHTHNVHNYIWRCFLFGLISEVPFNFALMQTAFYPQSQNVYFSLTTGLCTIYCLERIKGMWKVPKPLAGRLDIGQYRVLASVLCVATGAGLAELLEMDYHWMGIVLIVLLYYCRDYPPLIRSLVGAIAFSFEKTAPIAFIPIYFYNGERGRQNKNFFYLIYPIHLILFGVIRYIFL